MSDLTPTSSRPRRRTKQFGRHGLMRLQGLDLRTKAGRQFKASLARLLAEFGPEHEAGCRELAALKLTIEATRADTLSSDTYRAVQARRVLPPIMRLAESLESKLRSGKPTAEPEKAAPQNFAAWLLQREGE